MIVKERSFLEHVAWCIDHRKGKAPTEIYYKYDNIDIFALSCQKKLLQQLTEYWWYCYKNPEIIYNSFLCSNKFLDLCYRAGNYSIVWRMATRICFRKLVERSLLFYGESAEDRILISAWLGQITSQMWNDPTDKKFILNLLSIEKQVDENCFSWLQGIIRRAPTEVIHAIINKNEINPKILEYVLHLISLHAYNSPAIMEPIIKELHGSFLELVDRLLENNCYKITILVTLAAFFEGDHKQFLRKIFSWLEKHPGNVLIGATIAATCLKTHDLQSLECLARLYKDNNIADVEIAAKASPLLAKSLQLVWHYFPKIEENKTVYSELRGLVERLICLLTPHKTPVIRIYKDIIAEMK